MVVLLNGAFGIGKTTVARLLVRRLRRAILFNPEIIGSGMQRTLRAVGRDVYDFQDLPSWRGLTVTGVRMTRAFFPNVIVPMAFSNVAYLDEVRGGIGRFEPEVFHFCLRAPVEVVHERLRRRGPDRGDPHWPYERAAECCAVHGGEEFATHIDASERGPEEIAEEILERVLGSSGPREGVLT